MYLRILDLNNSKSLFLLGARQTGKSSLLKQTFPNNFTINLLKSDEYLRYLKSPQLLRDEVRALDKNSLIIIDEIQKIPILLNEVHLLIEEGYKFILTGSSARKLKRESSNLLGGRARVKNLFPLVSYEISDFDLFKALKIGTIPSIYLSDDPLIDLNSYAGTYLKEEIAAEGLIRGIDDFSRFLEIAAIDNCELLNFSQIASDIGLNSTTIKNYYEILSDTLVGDLLPPYKKTSKRKTIATSKFYFFDVGVANILAKQYSIEEGTPQFGKCLEHFIYSELRAYLSYRNKLSDLSFWRTRSGIEVDFLIGDKMAIEVKATRKATKKHFKGLLALDEELSLQYKILISLDNNKRKLENGILVLPVNDFLELLWSDHFEII